MYKQFKIDFTCGWHYTSRTGMANRNCSTCQITTQLKKKFQSCYYLFLLTRRILTLIEVVRDTITSEHRPHQFLSRYLIKPYSIIHGSKQFQISFNFYFFVSKILNKNKY